MKSTRGRKGVKWATKMLQYFLKIILHITFRRFQGIEMYAYAKKRKQRSARKML